MWPWIAGIELIVITQLVLVIKARNNQIIRVLKENKNLKAR